ncbi:MAG: HAD family phosphatase [Mucinivorans sp.]
MIKGVIFDMDGVLVDNRDVHVAAFQKWCEKHNIVLPSSFLINFFGMGNEDIFRQVLADPDLELSAIKRYSAEKEAIYRDMFAQTIAPVAGLVALLDELKKRGIKIAVGSSGMRPNVEFVLRACHIEQYFDAIADGDMIHRAKPDPEVFLLGAELMGLRAHECFVFEDSFAGIAAARAAGMGVGALATTFARPLHTDYDFLIDDFTQITADEFIK